MSGKSLSIGSIDSIEKLTHAWERIKAQPELDEVILQKEIKWETHITLIYENDFFFAELKTPQGRKQFVYLTGLTQILTPEMKQIKLFLWSIQNYLKQNKFWIMEAGLKNGKFHLFQIHPVNVEILSNIFSSEMVANIVFSQIRFNHSQSLWGFLKTEWQAWKFRKQMNQENFHPSLIFSNWEFLFNYFRLFCWLKSLKPDAQSFARFLAMSYQNKWFSSLVKKHLELANFFRKSASLDVISLGFQSQGMLFIGKGIIKGVVGDDIQTCEEISLAMIYQKLKPKVILTNEVGLLSHPVLASIENGVALVLAVGELPPQGAVVFLDFDLQILKIE